MSKEGVNKFISRVTSTIETSRKCNEITYGELVGALELIKLDFYMESKDEEAEEML